MKFTYKHAAAAATSLVLAGSANASTLGFEGQNSSWGSLDSYQAETIDGVTVNISNTLPDTWYKQFITAPGFTTGTGSTVLVLGGEASGNITFTFSQPVNLQSLYLYSPSTTGSFTGRSDNNDSLVISYNSEGSTTPDLSSLQNVTTLTLDSQQYGAGTNGYPYFLYFDNLTFTAAGDSDNVSDAVENGVPGITPNNTQGDGNGNGTPDSQEGNVTSGTFTHNSSTAYFTLVSSGSGNTNVTHVGGPSHPLPAGVTMPYGEFSFTVNGVSSGATVNLELFVPYDQTINGYTKWNNQTSQWDALTGVTVTHYPADNKTKIAFSLVEGGPYDDDLSANGTLVDDGGPSVTAAAATAIPIFGPFGSLLLASLFGFFGYRRLKN